MHRSILSAVAFVGPSHQAYNFESTRPKHGSSGCKQRAARREVTQTRRVFRRGPSLVV